MPTSRNEKIRSMTLIAMLTAMGVVLWIIKIPIPNVQPVTDMVMIITLVMGVGFGFTLAVLIMLVSNLVLGFGIWTIPQILAYAVCVLTVAALAKVTPLKKHFIYHDVYDKDYYTLTATIKNGQLNTGSTKKGVKWEWTADHAKKIKMSTSEFLKMFDAAKKSSLKGIQENGYDTPDNDSNNNSNSQGDNSSSSSDSIDAQERAAAFKNGGRWITDKSDPEYYSDANAYVTYLQIKDGVANGTTNPDGTETAKGMAENDN